jgi:LytR cell envelope-related transcriptional attenuator
MTMGGKVLLLSGCLVASGCVTDHTVQVRPISDPNSKLHFSGGLLAEGRGQLAIGAVGLALESFRTLQRQQPDNPEVYASIAACYAAMGRLDLTRTNLELALAYAPNDPALLQTLASTLDKLGETEQAAQVRTEVRMAAAARAQSQSSAAPVTPLGVPRAASMTVKVPEAAPPPAVAAAPEQRIAAADLGPAKVNLASFSLARIGKPALVARAEVAIPHAEVSPAVLALAQTPADGAVAISSVPQARVDLHAASAERVQQHGFATIAPVLVVEAVEPTARVLRPNAQPAVPPPPPISRTAERQQEDASREAGPYLERTSLREVALITVAKPERQQKLPSRSPELPRMAVIAPQLADRPAAQPAPRSLLAAAAVRWVPLRYAAPGQNVQLLNAARTNGLAARTRVTLVDRGWRKVAIGNARSVRQRSLVLYSPGRWHVAARLAAQFRCKAVRVASIKNVIVLLGRDAAFRRGATSRA